MLYAVVYLLNNLGNFEAAAGDFSDITTNATSILTWILSAIASVVSTVVSTPILYMPIIIGLVSVGVSFFLRLTWRG